MSNKFSSATAAIITRRNNVWLGLVALQRLFEFGFNKKIRKFFGHL